MVIPKIQPGKHPSLFQDRHRQDSNLVVDHRHNGFAPTVELPGRALWLEKVRSGDTAPSISYLLGGGVKFLPSLRNSKSRKCLWLAGEQGLPAIWAFLWWTEIDSVSPCGRGIHSPGFLTGFFYKIRQLLSEFTGFEIGGRKLKMSDHLMTKSFQTLVTLGLW